MASSVNATVCLFQPFGKIKIAGSCSNVGFPLFLFHLFLETMLLSKSKNSYNFSET